MEDSGGVGLGGVNGVGGVWSVGDVVVAVPAVDVELEIVLTPVAAVVEVPAVDVGVGRVPNTVAAVLKVLAVGNGDSVEEEAEADTGDGSEVEDGVEEVPVFHASVGIVAIGWPTAKDSVFAPVVQLQFEPEQQ